ncbi:MAG: DNA-primase RepB domain-containing protein [Vicinamibacterales bacterium]
MDRHAPRAFLAAGYAPDDWVAILLKSYRTGEAVQRVLPVATVASERFQAWLRAKNAQRWEVYVSTNAVAPGQRSRTRDRVAAVRHVFLDADEAGQQLLAALAARSDIPPPSYILRTSLGRVHVLWRVQGFEVPAVEALQKHLAKELDADPAATSAAQLTRLPGFLSHKRRDPFAVSLLLGAVSRVYDSRDFPGAKPPRRTEVAPSARRRGASKVARARSYLRSVPPAVAGERGDAHTFRVCCRVVRGFALSEVDALAALSEWNERCVPPWRMSELAAKVRNAGRYGRETIGARVLGNGYVPGPRYCG